MVSDLSMKSFRMPRIAVLAAALSMAFVMVAVDHADARRGGSFGSRGTRTFQQAPATRTAPQPAAPVERSMTPNPGPGARTNPAAGQPQTAPRPGFLNGFGGTMLRGLLIGGLIGMLLGHGLGGMAGMLGMLVQILLIGLVVVLALRFFRSRQQQPTLAGAGPAGSYARDEEPGRDEVRRESGTIGGFRVPNFGSGSTASAAVSEDISLDQRDLDTFERLLGEVQGVYAAEDHGRLRDLATPEMVSYLSEELAENAKKGVRNDVSDVKLLQADIAESWREDDRDYATAAFQYEGRDVMRDRATGRTVSGEDRPTETTELWTFVRPRGGDWKLSAIQEA
jgi:predicted lipid-binding transport protein (Tim44 family)